VEKPAEVKEIVGQKRLADKVTGILERIEKELDSVEVKIGESMHILDTDNDGMVRPHICCCPGQSGYLCFLASSTLSYVQGAMLLLPAQLSAQHLDCAWC
jgi:hypothetical protein